MTLTLTIHDILTATPRARIVRLDLGGRRFDYLAGQAILVGRPERPDAADRGERRPYSLASSTEESRRANQLELLVGVDATGAAGPHFPLERGATVEIEGPLGSFTFPTHPRERRFVFIAGGTGIAPLRAMLHHALTIPHEQIGLFYSARTPDEFAYEEEFRALSREGKIEFRQTATRSADEAWTGARGRIGRAEVQSLVHDPATLCFICGPPALVAATSALVSGLGIPESRIQIERWG